MSTVPPGGAVNVDRAVVFEIEFSESVKKSDLIANLYVSPQRAGEPEVDWSGQRVRITWGDSLRDDVTYRVTVGSRLSDIRNNPMAEPYTFAFSTGDKIDSGRVTGRVWQDMVPAPAYDVLAYMLTGQPWQPSHPDYQTQTNDSGRFDLPYLPDAVFRVVAVQDKNGNAQPDHGEFVAVAPHDVPSSRTGRGGDVEMYAVLYDTLRFEISACTVSDDGVFLIGLSHAVDTSWWTARGFAISDSATGEPVAVSVLDPLPPRYTIVPAIPDNAQDGRVYRVAFTPADDVAPLNVRGTPMSACTSYVTYPEIVDTTGPRIQWTRFPTATEVVVPRAPIEWVFSEPVRIDSLDDAVAVYDSVGNVIPGTVKWADVRHVLFTPESPWPDTTTVVVTLDSASVRDHEGNPSVSQTFNWTFPPLTASGMGDVSLRIPTTDSALIGTPVVILAQSVRLDLHRRWTIVDTDTAIVSLPAGNWLFGAFRDLDGNGRFGPGRVSPPYRAAEPRVTLPDTVGVRARFTVEDISLGL